MEKYAKDLCRHECHPLCPPFNSGGKSKLDAYALLHAAVGGRPFTPLPHRMSARPSHAASGHYAGWRSAGLGRTSDGKQNSPSIRFDEGASAEAKLALIMPSEEEKGDKALTGA